MKRVYLVFALSLTVMLAAAEQARAEFWSLVGASYNQGPLTCNPPSGEFLDWANVASGFNATVKYQTDSRTVVNVASWKHPVYMPSTGKIYMEIAVQQLRQNAVSRIYVQRKNPIAMGDGNVIGSAQVRTGIRNDYQVVNIQPWGDSNLYFLEVWFTTGGMCTSYLVRYTFQRS